MNKPTDAELDALWRFEASKNWDSTLAMRTSFARAVEAEVRRQDEALIRQMVESMCWAARVMTISEDEAPGYFAAIAAARARMSPPAAEQRA